MGRHSPTGYVTDVPYTYYFIRELAPEWLDFVVTIVGLDAPTRRNDFTWCELGCGQGVTASLLAATHPSAKLHAIDAMPSHIEHARRLCDSAGIANLTLHATDFASATQLDLPQFDYMVAHGVYSWIDAQGRSDMRRCIDRHLKPGGLAFVSYNAMPGWANDAPFQFLVRELAGSQRGDSTERFLAAMEQIQTLADAGAPALEASAFATTGWSQQRTIRPLSYFAHEFLPLAWQPRYVTEVRAEMASIGLTPAGSASVVDNFDSFVLRRAERMALEPITDANLRELVRDYFLNQRFRRDVFVRGARPISKEERFRRLSEAVLDLQLPADFVKYEMGTEAGRVSFDNRGARAVVAALAEKPKRVVDMTASDVPTAELVGNALTLFAANVIRPVAPMTVDVRAVNAALVDRLAGSEPLPDVALPVGTALELTVELHRALQEAEPPGNARIWAQFLRRYERQ